MKNARLSNALMLLFGVLLMPFIACTNVYFETPVPAGGTVITEFPADWAGLYQVENEDTSSQSELEKTLVPCYRLEPEGNKRLLVGSEVRLRVRDLPKLKTLLEKEKQAGDLLDYQLTESFLIYTAVIHAENKPDVVEQQFSALQRKGSWYVLVQTMKPFRMYDLTSARVTEFDEGKTGVPTNAIMPDADSISSKPMELVARTLNKRYYFNSRQPDDKYWGLLVVEQPAKDRLVVQVSNLENTDAFEKKLDYYNTITPFRKDDANHYIVRPDDAALNKLLDEQHLFDRTYLRKISE